MGGARGSELTKGSIEVALLDAQDVVLSSFTAVAGKLDTNKLESGEYIKPVIISIFENLKKTGYEPVIFESIKYNLVAFIISIALEQKIVEYVNTLSEKVYSGELSIDEFNKNIKDKSDTFASKVPDKYFEILEKIKTVIDENINILN